MCAATSSASDSDRVECVRALLLTVDVHRRAAETGSALPEPQVPERQRLERADVLLTQIASDADDRLPELRKMLAEMKLHIREEFRRK